MANYEYTFSLNGRQMPATINEYIEDEHTLYNILFEDRTLTIYKNTPYTWTSDDPQEFNKAAIQSLGEKIDNPQVNES